MTGAARAGQEPSTGRTRVLLIDHVAGLESRRPFYAALARAPGVELTLLAPATWIENYRLVQAPAAPPGARLCTGHVAWRGYENRGFFLTGLARAIRAARPDIVHLVEEPFGLFALQATALLRLLRPRARLIFYTFDNGRAGFHYPYRPGWLYAAIQRWVQRRAAVGTTGCLDARDILRSRGFAGPVRFIPFGIDPAVFHPEAGPGAPPGAGAPRRGPFTIGYVGRFLPVKGLPVLLKAVRRLETPWRLLLVGDGPERGALAALIAAEGLGDRVEIRAPLPPADLAALYRGLDVLVLPSITLPRLREQFGRVLIEAMASGTPVIGSNSGSIPEVIGEAGLVVPEGDPAALAAALEELARDEERRRELARRGVARVAAHFTWERVAERVLDLYAALGRDAVTDEAWPAWCPSGAADAPAEHAAGAAGAGGAAR